MNKNPMLEEMNAIMARSGGSLYLSGTGITSLPEGLTVSDSLYLRNTGITNTTNVKRLRNGDYVEGRNVIYDGVNYAHCDKWRDGIADLNFKAAKDRGAAVRLKGEIDHE